MPFKSQAQRRWMYANKPEMAKQWEDDTPPGRLPSRIHSKSTSQTLLAGSSQRRIRNTWRRVQRQARR